MGQLRVLLRGLSEWFQLVRQLPHERTAEDSALNAPGVVGTRKGQLAIKLLGGKHSARRSRLAEIPAPQLFCPICPVWGTSGVGYARRGNCSQQQREPVSRTRWGDRWGTSDGEMSIVSAQAAPEDVLPGPFWHQVAGSRSCPRQVRGTHQHTAST